MNLQQLVNKSCYIASSTQAIYQGYDTVVLYLDSYLYNNEYYMTIMKKYISNSMVIIHYEICKGYIKHTVCNSLSDFECLCKEVFDKLYGRS